VGIPWTDEMIALAWKHSNIFIGSDAHSPKYWPRPLVDFINSHGQDTSSKRISRFSILSGP
jgi:predicted TIM-barrel fold metal-dependent hydrolase